MTEKPPTGRHARAARQYAEFSSVTRGTPSFAARATGETDITPIGAMGSAACIRKSALATLSGLTYLVSWFTRAKVLARSVPSKSRRAIGKSSNRRSVAPNPCGFHWCVPGSFAGRSSAWGYAGCGEKLASPRSVAFNPHQHPPHPSAPTLVHGRRAVEVLAHRPGEHGRRQQQGSVTLDGPHAPHVLASLQCGPHGLSRRASRGARGVQQ